LFYIQECHFQIKKIIMKYQSNNSKAQSVE
jgi:hypothetical protein